MTKETQAELIARLRENLEHIAGQLVERTAELKSMNEAYDGLVRTTDILFGDNMDAIDRMGERKPYKLIAITAGIAFGMGVIVGVAV